MSKILKAVEIMFLRPALGGQPGTEELLKTAMNVKLKKAVKAERPDIEKDLPASLSTLPGLKDGIVSADEALSREIELKSTFWPRHPDISNRVIIRGYQFKGCLKAAISRFIRRGDFKGIALSSYKNWAHDGLIILPWGAMVMGPQGKFLEAGPEGVLEFYERPLRIDPAGTGFGARSCLARSEMIPAGSRARFLIEVHDIVFPKTCKGSIREDELTMMLDNGQNEGGLGQWVESGAGAFKWREVSAAHVDKWQVPKPDIDWPEIEDIQYPGEGKK